MTQEDAMSNSLAAPAGTVQLPKTGQTISYAKGDDGDLEMGVAPPSPRFTDKGDNTVSDNMTGLMWTKNARLTNDTLNWQAALDYVAGMNSGTNPNFGHTDWRLPNVNELKSLADYSQKSPALPLGHPFTNVDVVASYWSSTSAVCKTDNSSLDATYALSVFMGYGSVVGYFKQNKNNYAWPVRSGQVANSIIYLPKTGQTISYAKGDDGDLKMGVAPPSPRFTDKGDNTVSDNLTGLMWTKSANLFNFISWQTALDYVARMNADPNSNFGHTDWRLPNVNELKSLTDNTQVPPALPQGHPFTNVQESWCWSSTTAADTTSFGWYLHMGNGNMDRFDKSQFACAWPVRTVTVLKPPVIRIISP